LHDGRMSDWLFGLAASYGRRGKNDATCRTVPRGTGSGMNV